MWSYAKKRWKKNVCFIIGILKFNSSIKYTGKYNNYYANTMYNKVFLKYITISKLVYITVKYEYKQTI